MNKRTPRGGNPTIGRVEMRFAQVKSEGQKHRTDPIPIPMEPHQFINGSSIMKRLAGIEEDREIGTAQTIIIDPSGDICLAVESGNTSKELQLSSKIFSAASSVFQTIFKPNFWEGLEPHSHLYPTPISLPDDDGDALTTVCRIVHYRAHEALSSLAAEDLLQIGVICDKYDFIGALRLWSSSSLRAAIVGADDNNMYTLLEAAYLLDSWEEFGQVSIWIISHHVGAFKDGSTDTFDEGHIVRKITRALEKSIQYLEARRQDAFFAAVVAVEKAVADLFWIGRVSDWHPGVGG
ncbi:hypothetical protein LTR53_004750 [Teratosphaeriaceae sp. CCFEE 6253]|nr:hypothetical protein LTR53_004750 [Teratosphaeriaceae sp. CCFEE 6253]